MMTSLLTALLLSVQILTLSNDRDDRMNRFDLILNSDETSTQPISAISYLGSSDTPVVSTWEQVTSPGGTVIERQSGVNAIILSANYEPNENKGSLKLRFIKNGLKRTYNECTANLNRDSSGAFGLSHDDGTPIKSAKFITWALGIKNIEGFCPEKK